MPSSYDRDSLPQKMEFIKNYVFLHVQTAVTFKALSIWCTAPIKTFLHSSKQVLHRILPLFSFLPRWLEMLMIYPRTNKQNQKKKRKVEPPTPQVGLPGGFPEVKLGRSESTLGG